MMEGTFGGYLACPLLSTGPTLKIPDPASELNQAARGISLVLGSPKSGPVLQVQSHQCQREGKDGCPQQYTSSDWPPARLHGADYNLMVLPSLS